MSARSREPIILRENAVLLSFDPLSGLTGDERKRVTKYLTVKRDSGSWAVSRSQRYAGLVHTNNAVFFLEPPFGAQAFLYLLFRRSALEKFADDAAQLASKSNRLGMPEIMRVLAVLLVREAQTLASGHIAQSYVQKTERLAVLRGRPLWQRQAGRVQDGTVECRFEEKSTDVLENRLVLAALIAGERWLAGTSMKTAARTQQFIWRSLAEPYTPSRHDFDLVGRRLNRLTDPYRPALALARALLFGFDIDSGAADTDVSAPVFDLASLFETLVELTAKLAYTGTPFRVRPQATERQAIVTRSGTTYRSIRPDIVVERSSKPVLIIDSKFKPKYTRGGLEPSADYRVSSADIFQTFFYATRLAQLEDLSSPVPAAVAAPLLAGGVPPLDDYRELRWQEDHTEIGPSLRLLLLPVDETVAALRRDDVEFCRSILAWPNGVLNT